MRQSPVLLAGVERALRAPSVHNTQPWRWRVADKTVDLHADWGRHLISTDPDRRDLLLSCGAALHHLQVALAAQDRAVEVKRLPSLEDRGHLATLILGQGAGDVADADLSAAIERRRTDRRRMSTRAVPARFMTRLVDQANRAGAFLIPVVDPRIRNRLLASMVEAGDIQELAVGYSGELQSWTHRYAGAQDGIPAASMPASSAQHTKPSPLRRLPGGNLRQPSQPTGQGVTGDAAQLLVLSTARDDDSDHLRAGEATSAVLLAATQLGLATTPLSQALEVSTVRHAIRHDVLHSVEHPQLLIRVGWPATGAVDLPPTPRRDLASVSLPAALGEPR